MEEADEETVADISTKTWNVMKYSLRKEGYREGAASGKEAVLQHSFDSGYKEGFKLAYAKGFVLAFIAVLENENKSEELQIPEVKYDLNNDNCILCNTDHTDIRNGDVKSALKFVQDHANIEVNSLKEKYGQLIRNMNQDSDVICKRM